jgi:hypothetical protein
MQKGMDGVDLCGETRERGLQRDGRETQSRRVAGGNKVAAVSCCNFSSPLPAAGCCSSRRHRRRPCVCPIVGRCASHHFFHSRSLAVAHPPIARTSILFLSQAPTLLRLVARRYYCRYPRTTLSSSRQHLRSRHSHHIWLFAAKRHPTLIVQLDHLSLFTVLFATLVVVSGRS